MGSHIPVRVFDRGGDFLMLVLMLDDGEELGQDVLEPLVLEYVSTRGVVRFEGEAVLQERDLVRFEVSDRARGHPAPGVRAGALAAERRRSATRPAASRSTARPSI